MFKPLLVALISLSLVLGGCTTSRLIPMATHTGEVAPAVKSGDRVTVTMKSGEIRRMKVQSVDAQSLTGENLDDGHQGSSSQIALADVQSILVRKVSVWRSGGLALGIVAAAAAALIGIYLVRCSSNEDNCIGSGE